MNTCSKLKAYSVSCDSVSVENLLEKIYNQLVAMNIKVGVELFFEMKESAIRNQIELSYFGPDKIFEHETAYGKIHYNLILKTLYGKIRYYFVEGDPLKLVTS